jgi:hypothetical protein
MKLIGLGILVLAIVAFLVGPTLLVQKKCYDTAQMSVSEIQQNIMMRGWSPQQVCQSRFTVLTELESCVKPPDDANKFTADKEMIAGVLLPYIRPLTNTVKQQQAQHDAECSDFKSLLFSGSL